MSAETAIGLAEEWLWQTLSADSTLATLVGTRIYASQIPEGGTYPALIYQLLTSIDNVAQGFSYWQTESHYIVRAADRIGSIATLDTIMARVRQLLHGQASVRLTNGYMLACQRERGVVVPSVVAGVATRELAAIYLVITQEG